MCAASIGAHCMPWSAWSPLSPRVSMETEGVRETEGERRTGWKEGWEEGLEREYLICILNCPATSCIHSPEGGRRSRQRALALETSRLLNALHPVCVCVFESEPLSPGHAQTHTHTHTHTHTQQRRRRYPTLAGIIPKP